MLHQLRELDVDLARADVAGGEIIHRARQDERPALERECRVDERIVVDIDRVAVIEVAVEPAGERTAGTEAGVEARVIVQRDDAIEIRVAVVGVLDQRIGCVYGVAVEQRSGAKDGVKFGAGN